MIKKQGSPFFYRETEIVEITEELRVDSMQFFGGCGINQRGKYLFFDTLGLYNDLNFQKYGPKK